MATRIKWYGPEYTQKLYRHVDKGMANLTERYKAKVVAAAPVDTGALRESISTKKMKNMSYRVQSDLDYALYVEFGTSTNPPHPYFRPGMRGVS